jgi:hypothetical protein
MPPAVIQPSQQRAAPQNLLDAQKELLSSSFSRASAYTNLILGAGYAGFFAVWAFTRDQLTPPQVLWSALLVTVSLLSFVVFEVYKNFYLSRALLSLARAVADEANFAVRILEWKRDQQAREIRFGRIWASAFWLTLLFGFGGGLVLVYAFVRGLLRWYFQW